MIIVCRCESALYLWEQVADYLNENDETAINMLIDTMSSQLISSSVRLANTMFRLLAALAHLISTSSHCAVMYPRAVSLTLPPIDTNQVDTIDQALRTLQRLVEERIPEIEVKHIFCSQS